MYKTIFEEGIWFYNFMQFLDNIKIHLYYIRNKPKYVAESFVIDFRKQYTDIKI